MAAGAVLLGVVPCHAQEVGVLIGRGTSDFSEFASPTSIALQAHLPIRSLPFLHVAGAYRSSRDEDVLAGRVCDQYWPLYSGCLEEGIAYDTRLTQWEAGFGLRLHATERIELRAGLRAVWSRLEGSSVGAETGRSAGRFYPSGWTRSTALSAGVSWAPLSTRHLRVLGQFRSAILDMRGCATDVGTPFCGRNGVTTFELGIAVAR